MKRFLFACALLIAGLGALPAPADAPSAAGPNFLVPQAILRSQLEPDVAQDTAGDMVAVWLDGSTAANGEIKARLFTAAGAPRSDEITVFTGVPPPRGAETPPGALGG